MIKRFFYSLACLFTLIGAGANALADGPWSLDTEVLFLQLNTSIGTRANNVFGYDPAQRYTLSYTGANNVGLRFKHFSYDRIGVDPGVSRTRLDMYNADLELFKKLNFSNCTSLDISGGIRYNDSEVSFPSTAEPNDFHGIGVILGMKGMTRVFTGGDIYARGALAMLAGDGSHDSNALSTVRPARDIGRTHTEIAIGYQHTLQYDRISLIPHAGFEFQNLSGYQIDVVDEHPEGDFMLSGFSLGLTGTF